MSILFHSQLYQTKFIDHLSNLSTSVRDESGWAGRIDIAVITAHTCRELLRLILYGRGQYMYVCRVSRYWAGAEHDGVCVAYALIGL